jgi:hypothetical protein
MTEPRSHPVHTRPESPATAGDSERAADLLSARQAKPSVELTASESKGARGYSWEPFQSGNQVALTHGARSERAIAEKAAEVHAELTTVAPWLSEAHFAPAVVRYLRAASREQLLDAHIAKVSAERGAGAVTPGVWEQVTAAARLAAKLGQDLGLDPIGHARLKAVASGAEISALWLADLAQEGKEIRQRREREAADVIDATTIDEEI